MTTVCPFLAARAVTQLFEVVVSVSHRRCLLLQVADVDQLAETVEVSLGCAPNYKYLYNKETDVYENRPHQYNCTYYSAIGKAFPRHQDRVYLMARAIQFFTPGIPMVYYVGLFAGSNDFKVSLCTLSSLRSSSMVIRAAWRTKYDDSLSPQASPWSTMSACSPAATPSRQALQHPWSCQDC